MTITVGGIADGSDESLIISGNTVDLSQPLAAPLVITVGGTTFNIAYDGTTFTITDNAGIGVPHADFETLLSLTEYENTKRFPVEGNRTFAFAVNDGLVDSAIATSTITVDGDNDLDGVGNLVDVDDDNDGILDVDEGFSQFTGGDQYVDYVIRFNQLPPLPQAVNSIPEAALGAPDADQVSLGGVGSELVLGYRGAVFTNSGNASADISLHERGAPETVEILLRPTAATRALLDEQGVLSANAEGFYSFGIIDGVNPLDIDALTLNAFAAGQLEFDAINLVGADNAGGLNPGADVIAVEAFTLRVFGQSSRDSDNDGIADHLDIDSDNDGITDNVEAQSTAGYIAPSGIGGTSAFIDSNNDGLDDSFDLGVIAGSAATGIGLGLVDTDGDGVTDTIDLDSDNDGSEDASERGAAGPITAQTGVTVSYTHLTLPTNREV